MDRQKHFSCFICGGWWDLNCKIANWWKWSISWLRWMQVKNSDYFQVRIFQGNFSIIFQSKCLTNGVKFCAEVLQCCYQIVWEIITHSNSKELSDVPSAMINCLQAQGIPGPAPWMWFSFIKDISPLQNIFLTIYHFSQVLW